MNNKSITDLSNELFDKLSVELPFDEDTNINIAQALKEFVMAYPERIGDFEIILDTEPEVASDFS